MTSTVVPHQRISSDDVKAFCSALEAVLRDLGYQDLKDLRLFRKGEDGIAVSFDPDWQPFLNSTFGWHNSPSKPRWPIVSKSRVLDVARTWLMNLDERPPGGRVFISRERVVRVRDRSQKSILGTWGWDGDEPVATIRRIFESAVDARVNEARDAARKAIVEATLKKLHGDPAAEELYAEAREHLQRVAPDLWCGPKFFFDQLRDAAEAGAAAGEAVAGARVAGVVRECEGLCLLARRALHQGDRAAADVWWALARAQLSLIGQDDQFERIDAAAVSSLASELEEEQRSRRLSPIYIGLHRRVIKPR